MEPQWLGLGVDTSEWNIIKFFYILTVWKRNALSSINIPVVMMIFGIGK